MEARIEQLEYALKAEAEGRRQLLFALELLRTKHPVCALRACVCINACGLTQGCIYGGMRRVHPPLHPIQ